MARNSDVTIDERARVPLGVVATVFVTLMGSVIGAVLWATEVQNKTAALAKDVASHSSQLESHTKEFEKIQDGMTEIRESQIRIEERLGIERRKRGK